MSPLSVQSKTCPIRVAIVTTDAREHERTYRETTPRFATGHQSLLEGFAQTKGIEVHVICCTQQPMHSPEKLAENMWFHSLHVPKIGWLRTLYQGCIRAVRKKLSELQPDLVHGHGTERECGISAALAGFLNLVTIHGNIREQARHSRPRIGSYLWLQARVEDFAVRRTLGVFCNSAYTESVVHSRARRTWRVPHALRLSFFDSIAESAPRPCILLNAGVITRRKRQLELLGVAESLYRAGLKFEFRFIGFVPTADDGYAREFLQRIKPMEAAGYARFLGPQPENKLVECFDSVAGVVHFPTEEAFGNVVIEALSRNLKFFGSRIGGIIDTTEGMPGAELFDKDDWTGLSDGIARWIAGGHVRPTRASRVVRKRYHPMVIADKHLDIYKEVLSSCGRGLPESSKRKCW
jgi:glycosyltransferase involved in cell wall biosynthesis